MVETNYFREKVRPHPPRKSRCAMSRTAPAEYRAFPADDLPPDAEDRIRRLEEAVAALQETELVEERVAERVVGRLRKSPPPELSELAGREPRAVSEPPANGSATASPESAATPEKSGWLFLDLWTELRTMARMIADHRFKLSVTARLGPIGVLVGYIFAWLLIGSIPFVGWALERVIDVALIVILYVILGREARRYRDIFGPVSRWR